MAKEKNYLEIAKRTVLTPAEAKHKWRFLIYSRHKKGKTTFCMSANEIGQVLILDPEKGAEKYRKANPHIWPIHKWEDIDDAWGALRTGKLTPKLLGKRPSGGSNWDPEQPYDWAALDGMTKINNMALRFVMKMQEEMNLERRPGIVDRRDYNKSGELLKQLMLNFDALPVGVIYTAQERFISVEDNEDETAESSSYFVPDMPQGARGSLNSIVDVIGRLYVAKAQFKKGDDIIERPQRRLWVGVHPQYDTGYRSEYEPPDFIKNPTVKRVIDALSTGQ